jgi:hypothetical protein
MSILYNNLYATLLSNVNTKERGADSFRGLPQRRFERCQREEFLLRLHLTKRLLRGWIGLYFAWVQMSSRQTGKANARASRVSPKARSGPTHRRAFCTIALTTGSELF